ncbi:MAG: hypothetical protein HYV26_01500 [Candidatus Hydrogenedentes bacterium]|nr:hypothetical protein [Candidatus Hydrogenedentota bacterium]
MTGTAEVSPFVLYPIVLCFFGGLIAFAYWWTRREQRAREHFAAKHGLVLDSTGLDIPRSFHLMRRVPAGARAEVLHAMSAPCGSGEWGVCVLGFYSGSVPDRRARAYHVLLGYLQHRDLHAPRFVLTPRTLRTRILSLLAGKGVQLVGAPGIPSGLVLECEAEEAARAFLTTPVLAALQQAHGLTIEGQGDVVVVYKPARMLQLQRFRPRDAARLLAVIRILASSRFNPASSV